MSVSVRKIALAFCTFFSSVTCLANEFQLEAGIEPFYAEVSEEALFARRIAEFWKDKDAALAKSQIEQFFRQYPASIYQEPLFALLGEIYLQEKNYGKALTYYNQIYSPAQKEKILAPRLECLYRLGMFSELKDELKTLLPKGEKPITDKESSLRAVFYAELLLKEAEKEKGKNEEIVENDENSDLIKASKRDEAKKIYVRLLESNQKAQAFLGLGDIALQEGKGEEAVKWYSNAAEIIPERRVELLLVVAQLLFEQGKYGELLHNQDLYQSILTPQHAFEIDVWLGRSYFALGQYEETLALLTPHLAKGDKPTLLTALSAAYELEDAPIVNRIATIYATRFSNDEAVARVFFIQAAVLKNGGFYPEAAAIYEKLQKSYPDFNKQEEIAYELAATLFEQNLWGPSHTQFLKFINQYPSSPFYLHALHYLPIAACQSDEAFGDLFIDIDRLIAAPQGDQEKILTLSKIAKELYDRKKFLESEALSTKILLLKPSLPLQAQTHFLLAACALELGHDGKTFALHAEKVLQLRPDFPGKERLREKLVNSYLQSKEKEKAAAHLYIILEDKGELSQEMLLWLANFYYDKTQVMVPEAYYGNVQDKELLPLLAKGILAFEAVLGSDPAIHPETLSLEQEYFKLSNLYAWRGQHDAQVVLLQNLHEQQRKYPDWKWTLRTRTLLALAEGYRAIGENEKAIHAYEEIVNSRISDTASLYRAKLERVRLHEGKMSLDDPLTVELLKNLKDLQIKKNIKFEPIHLEAALDYARLRSSLEPEENQKEHYYFLLQRVKEDFSEKKDLISKEYHKERENSPAQNQIYQAYMLLIDAHLFQFEGEQDSLKKQTATALYKSLLKGKFAVSKYLIDQAQSGLRG